MHDLWSIVRTRILGTLPSFKTLHFDQIPSWLLILDQKQIYRPNMNRIEYYFCRETAVYILLKEAAYSVHARPVPGRGANH